MNLLKECHIEESNRISKVTRSTIFKAGELIKLMVLVYAEKNSLSPLPLNTVPLPNKRTNSISLQVERFSIICFKQSNHFKLFLRGQQSEQNRLVLLQ